MIFKNTSVILFILGLVVGWALIRLYKRWTRRCEHCGSIRYKRWHEREFQRPTSGGKGMAISVTHKVCLNQDCIYFLKDIEVKAYEKEFPLERMTS